MSAALCYCECWGAIVTAAPLWRRHRVHCSVGAWLVAGGVAGAWMFVSSRKTTEKPEAFSAAEREAWNSKIKTVSPSTVTTPPSTNPK